MAPVRCLECGHEWTLSKPRDEYDDGPRCSECGGYDIESTEATQSAAARAFQFFIDGGTPQEAVANGLGTPDEISDLWEQYQAMADEHEALREEIETEVHEEIRPEVEENLRQEFEEKFIVDLPCAECGKSFIIDNKRKSDALRAIIENTIEEDEPMKWLWGHSHCENTQDLEDWAPSE